MLVDVEKDDLWTPDLDAEETNLFNAKLFPVPSKTDRTTTTARDLLLNLMRKSNIDTDMVEVWKNSQRLSVAEVSLLCKKKCDLSQSSLQDSKEALYKPFKIL